MLRLLDVKNAFKCSFMYTFVASNVVFKDKCSLICINIIIKTQTLKVIQRSPDPSCVILGDTLILIMSRMRTVQYWWNRSCTCGIGVAWQGSSDKLLYEKGRLNWWRRHPWQSYNTLSLTISLNSAISTSVFIRNI